MTADPRAARTIAAGGNPLWEKTFPHPEHGELTFRARLPLATDSLKHSIAIDNRLELLDAEPSVQTMIFASALAGMVDELLVELPVVAERHEEDAESGRELVVKIKYDPETESRPAFLRDVWLAFSAWRSEMLSDSTVSAVGKFSEGPATSSDGSNTESAEPTEPPSPTPAS